MSLASTVAPGTVMLAQANLAAVQGDLDLSRDAPLSGSYSGADDMALFWSMSSCLAADRPPGVSVAADPIAVTRARVTMERDILNNSDGAPRAGIASITIA